MLIRKQRSYAGTNLSDTKIQKQQAISHLAQLAKELTYVLKDNDLILHYSNEPIPEDVEILTHVCTKAKEETKKTRFSSS